MEVFGRAPRCPTKPIIYAATSIGFEGGFLATSTHPTHRCRFVDVHFSYRAMNISAKICFVCERDQTGGRVLYNKIAHTSLLFRIISWWLSDFYVYMCLARAKQVTTSEAAQGMLWLERSAHVFFPISIYLYRFWGRSVYIERCIYRNIFGSTQICGTMVDSGWLMI